MKRAVELHQKLKEQLKETFGDEEFDFPKVIKSLEQKFYVSNKREALCKRLERSRFYKNLQFRKIFLLDY